MQMRAHREGEQRGFPLNVLLLPHIALAKLLTSPACLSVNGIVGRMVTTGICKTENHCQELGQEVWQVLCFLALHNLKTGLVCRFCF